MISIAIDGPGGAGKSTIARAVAARRGFTYIDTGALYRAIALYVLRASADPTCAPDVAALLPQVHLELVHREDGQHVLLGGEDVSQEIRTPQVSAAASQVSALPAVRAFLLDTQRDMAKAQNVIMDGRDIGTVVLPHAQIKIFLTASSECRAKRRWEELKKSGIKISYDQVLSEMKARDERDTTRTASPTVPAPDAVIVDTTGSTLEESIEQMVVLIGNRLASL